LNSSSNLPSLMKEGRFIFIEEVEQSYGGVAF